MNRKAKRLSCVVSITMVQIATASLTAHLELMRITVLAHSQSLNVKVLFFFAAFCISSHTEQLQTAIEWPYIE